MLTSEDRTKLFAALELASDDVLLNAVADHKARVVAEQELWNSLRGFVGAKVSQPAQKTVDSEESVVPEEVENTEPPGDACTRIGSKNREAILGCCTKGRTLEEVAAFIHKRDPSDLLKLLWERGELTYDGEVYQCAQ